MNPQSILDEPAERCVERALDGADWLAELAAKLKSDLTHCRDAGHLDDALALAASVAVARACSLVAWHSVETAANLHRERLSLPVLRLHQPEKIP
jgi:hypothetical protein